MKSPDSNHDQSPIEITERLNDVSVGDHISINDRAEAYEVVATTDYSVTAIDDSGNKVNISQNLQSGGWNIHEQVYNIKIDF
ncbi:hypothetical protein [Haloquadratum walsbyi]|uniref:Transcriptional regulator n=1 Tax=Haloquadratum walsbyi (strain DSM 16854 / JCM 12705 / C23) TaxID=768065 RepID=G0LJI9_HALWC|nr:hypothetical protein [Haloquadratum walsbyi]CCC40923.1 uncharacterized protein Hqrw_3138 [Haloquadratum walsbyi C23]